MHISILKEVSLVEVKLIMRESILLSKMLLSAESWYTPFEYQIEKLEEVDLTFYRKLLNYHSKTGLEFLFGDSGTIPIKINSKM